MEAVTALSDLRRGCLAALMRLWLVSLQSKIRLTPRANDSPQTHSAGTNSDRVLVFGQGPAVGWGVASHELGLPGSLARALSSHTGRGTDVDVVAQQRLESGDALRVLQGVKLWRYDGIVIVLGGSDALRLCSLDRWRNDLTELLEWVAAATADSTQILITGIQPLRSVPTFDSWLGGIADRHAVAMNEITAEVCGRSRRTMFVPLTLPAGYFSDRHRSPSGYAAWSGVLADVMATGLTDARHFVGEPIRAPHEDPALAEDRRRQAVDRLALVDRSTEERLDRLVFAAQRGLGTETAVFTVLDHERQWHKSLSGHDLPEIPRSSSFCDHTIRKNGGMIVPDALADPRFSSSPLVLGDSKIRFYAGFPIESPSGERIGALCVLDPEPRAEGEVNLNLLRELALLAQREIWRSLYERTA